MKCKCGCGLDVTQKSNAPPKSFFNRRHYLDYSRKTQSFVIPPKEDTPAKAEIARRYELFENWKHR